MNIIISLSVGTLCFFMISASNRFDKGAKVIALVDLEVGQVLDGLRGYEVKARSWELERLRLQDGDFSVSSDGWEDNVAYSSLLSFLHKGTSTWGWQGSPTTFAQPNKMLVL